jgi:hypothetical protein
MRTLFILFFCFILTTKANSQANDAEALLYNVSIGGVFSTIGALINKKPNEKIGKIALKGFAQGSLGGFVTFGSKCVLREAQRNEDWKYIWGAKIMNAAGTSIKENAAMNRNFWDKWHINIGFNRIEFDTKGKFKINYKLMPIAFVYTVDAFFRFDNFEFKKSLSTGEFIFSNRTLNDARGAALAGYIVLDKTFVNDNNLITHEIIHLYQSNDFSILNTYYQKPLDNFSKNNETASFLNKYLYLELHYIPLRTFYRIESKSATNYYDNFFEHEAGYFSNTLR